MATPSKKTIAMSKALKDVFGFDRRNSIREDQCVPPPIGCGGSARVFSNDRSEKEYRISGLCQACQDEIFNKGE